jgi:hypothetical protein
MRPYRHSLAAEIREMLARGLPPKEVARLLNVHPDRVYSVKGVDKRRAREIALRQGLMPPDTNDIHVLRHDLQAIVHAIKREFHDEPKRAHSSHARSREGGR